LNRVAHGTRLSGPRSSERASFAHGHVGFHPPSDGVVKGDGRLFGVLDGVAEETSLGEENQLLELRSWHLKILARDSLQVVAGVQLSFRLSDDTTNGLAELLEADGIEDEERSIGLTCHDKLGFVVRGSGRVRFVRHRVEHDEHLLCSWSELQTVRRHDGVVAVVGDVTLSFHGHALHLCAEIVNVTEDGLTTSEGVNVGSLVHAVSAESYECVSDVEFALSTEVFVEVEHG